MQNITDEDVRRAKQEQFEKVTRWTAEKEQREREAAELLEAAKRREADAALVTRAEAQRVIDAAAADERHGQWMRGLITASIASMVAVFFVHCATIKDPPQPGPMVNPLELEDGPPTVTATDGAGDSADAGTVARSLPRKLFEGQKKEPCGPDQTTIMGGCWIEIVRKPRTDACGKDAFLHAGACYIPVMKAPALPNTLEP